MDFISIDFETATSERDSACELGLTFVKNGSITETKTWLIKPAQNTFNYFNVLLHGIKPEDVENEPTFDTIWQEVLPLIENQFIVAHNAGFDMSVLRRSLESYGIAFPKIQYTCSYIFSKKVWPKLPSYDLTSLCHLNGINPGTHRAGPDSLATALLTLKAFEITDLKNFDEIQEKLGTTIGFLYDGGYRPAETKRNWLPKENVPIIGNPEKHKPENIFYGKTVVFTGTLSSMVRSVAQQIVADIGGFIGQSVTADTDFLIIGHQDFRYVGESGISGKQAKAMKIIEKGANLEIMSEANFFQNIH